MIALEPHLNYWHPQDMFLITKDGPRRLSSKFSTDEVFCSRMSKNGLSLWIDVSSNTTI